jgi:hypothetical protein
LEKYMSSYMRERNVDALLVLRNENKWAMTGNFHFLLLDNFVLDIIFFLLFFILRCGFYGIFLLVADVEVKEDGVFIRLRKETVVCEDKDSSKRVSFSGAPESVVEEVPEYSGSGAAVSLEAIPEDLTLIPGRPSLWRGWTIFLWRNYFAVAVMMGRRLGLVILLAYLLILC